MRVRMLLLGCLTVAVLDITDAFVFNYLARGVAPDRVLKGIAAGFLGRETALAGGPGTALLGLGVHVFVASTVVIVFALAAARLPALRRKPVALGALYGIAVFIVMTYVVIPLSAINAVPRPSWPTLANLLFAHVCLVGIPAALFARRALAAGESAAITLA